MNIKIKFIMLVCGLLPLMSIFAGEAQQIVFKLNSPTVANGKVNYFTIDINEPSISNISAKFIGNDINLITGTNQKLVGIFGVDYDTKPGNYPLVIYWQKNGRQFQKKYLIKVKMHNYPVSILTVDSSKVKLSKPDENRVQYEKHLIQKDIYNKPSTTMLWKDKFHKPLKSIITDPYGVKRVFNGEKKSHHSGTDFRAPIGTKVRATNDGVIRLTKDLFYGGNVVIIDHGDNIFSIYAHLSKYEVREGDFIKKDQVIGLSGNTGRVNGPHLHFGIKLNSIAVDPIDFITVFNKMLNE